MVSGRLLDVSLVAVGTRNPVKIQAVAAAVHQIWPQANCLGCDVESGVPEQPMCEDDAIQGAINRAERALSLINSDLGVGLEGYTVDTAKGMFLSAWVAIIHQNEGGTVDTPCIGLGSGGRILVPESVAKQVRLGRELGPLMDDFTDQENTKLRQGAVGILTDGLVGRQEALTHGVLYALSRFVSPIAY